MNFGEAITLAASAPEKIFVRPVRFPENTPKFTAVCFGGSTSKILTSLQWYVFNEKKGEFELDGNYWLFSDIAQMEWEQVTIEQLMAEALDKKP